MILANVFCIRSSEFFKLVSHGPETALAYYVPDDTSLMYRLMYVIGPWNAIQRKGRKDISQNSSRRERKTLRSSDRYKEKLLYFKIPF